MQFSVFEEMYFESNNTITACAIRVKFSAIFLFTLFHSLPPSLPFYTGLSSGRFFVTITPAGYNVYNTAVNMSLVKRKIFFAALAHRFSCVVGKK